MTVTNDLRHLDSASRHGEAWLLVARAELPEVSLWRRIPLAFLRVSFDFPPVVLSAHSRVTAGECAGGLGVS